MAQPRIASRAPSACAACYQQKPDTIHVDYRAALDGRLVDPSQPRGGHVDWVIICADCLRNGVALLPEEKGRVDALEGRVTALLAEVEKEREYSAKLEDAVSVRPVRPEREPRAPKKSRAEGAAPRKPRYTAQDES
jgi:hypothetical protein